MRGRARVPDGRVDAAAVRQQRQARSSPFVGPGGASRRRAAGPASGHGAVQRLPRRRGGAAAAGAHRARRQSARSASAARVSRASPLSDQRAGDPGCLAHQRLAGLPAPPPPDSAGVMAIVIADAPGDRPRPPGLTTPGGTQRPSSSFRSSVASGTAQALLQPNAACRGATPGPPGGAPKARWRRRPVCPLAASSRCGRRPGSQAGAEAPAPAHRAPWSCRQQRRPAPSLPRAAGRSQPRPGQRAAGGRLRPPRRCVASGRLGTARPCAAPGLRQAQGGDEHPPQAFRNSAAR